MISTIGSPVWAGGRDGFRAFFLFDSVMYKYVNRGTTDELAQKTSGQNQYILILIQQKISLRRLKLTVYGGMIYP